MRCLLVLCPLLALSACGADPMPAANAIPDNPAALDASADNRAALDATAPDTQGPEAFPNSRLVPLPRSAQWLAADGQGRVYLSLQDGPFGRLQGEHFELLLSQEAAGPGKREVVHPPFALRQDGQVAALAETVLDGRDDHCDQQSQLTWVDLQTGQVQGRSQTEAFVSAFALSPEGLIIAPTLRYTWDLVNDPPTCLPAQPQHARLSAYSRDQGLVWSIESDRPLGPPTLDPARQWGFFSDAYRSVSAFDYSPSGHGALLWTVTLSVDGDVSASPPARGPNGHLYVTAKNRVGAITSEGALLWETATDSVTALSGEPVLSPSGAILATGAIAGPTSQERIWAVFVLSPQGTVTATLPLASPHLHAQALHQIGLMQLADGSSLSLIPPQAGTGALSDRLVLWTGTQPAGAQPTVIDGLSHTPPLLLPNGTLVAAWRTGALLVAPNVGALAASSWPCARGSNRRDGVGP